MARRAPPRVSGRGSRVGALALLLRVSAAAAFALLEGCHPHAGAPCSLGQAACEDDGRALACQAGIFVSVQCRGPLGCTKAGSDVACDDGVADEGDPCLVREPSNRACTPDHGRSLACEAGKFRLVETCRGSRHCHIDGESVTCDARVAERDDPCTHPGDFACSQDGRARLLCKEGRMRIDHLCRGPSGCRESDRACDETISDVGDPCGIPGLRSCSVDGEQELVCRAGQFAAERPCRKLGCRVEGRTVACD